MQAFLFLCIPFRQSVPRKCALSFLISVVKVFSIDSSASRFDISHSEIYVFSVSIVYLDAFVNIIQSSAYLMKTNLRFALVLSKLGISRFLCYKSLTLFISLYLSFKFVIFGQPATFGAEASIFSFCFLTLFFQGDFPL